VRVEAVVVVDSSVLPREEVRVMVTVVQTGLGLAGGIVSGVEQIVVTETLVVESTTCVLSPGDEEEVGPGSVDVARPAAGLSRSATNPRKRTVAAMAPRRAALIGRAAERVWGTSG